jgi:UrcA family protein
LVAIGLALCTAAAAADIPEITVTAPEVTRQPAGRSGTGAPVDLITVTHRVGYTDLDLSKSADAAKLEARVRASARSACDQLRKLVPFEDVDPKCAEQATKKAMAQETAAISAASHKR